LDEIINQRATVNTERQPAVNKVGGGPGVYIVNR